MRERARGACLTRALEIEFAWNMLSICPCFQSHHIFSQKRLWHLLLFFGGLLGITTGPKPCISPGIPPKFRCAPATCIGIAPFLSACNLVPFEIISRDVLCCVGGPPEPLAGGNWAKPFISRARHSRCGVRGVSKVARLGFNASRYVWE